MWYFHTILLCTCVFCYILPESGGFVSVVQRPRHSLYPMMSVTDAQKIIQDSALRKDTISLHNLQGTYVSGCFDVSKKLHGKWLL